MLKLLFLLCVFLCTACLSQKKLTGTYKDRGCAEGVSCGTLDLRADGTFSFFSIVPAVIGGMRSEGRWEKRADTLSLFHQKSLNYDTLSHILIEQGTRQAGDSLLIKIFTPDKHEKELDTLIINGQGPEIILYKSNVLAVKTDSLHQILIRTFLFKQKIRITPRNKRAKEYLIFLNPDYISPESIKRYEAEPPKKPDKYIIRGKRLYSAEAPGKYRQRPYWVKVGKRGRYGLQEAEKDSIQIIRSRYYKKYGVIFPGNSTNEFNPRPYARHFKPTLAEIAQAEQILLSQFSQLKFRLKGVPEQEIPVAGKKEIKKSTRTFNSYYRQYFGFYNEQGGKVIFINLLRFGKCTEKKFPDWKKRYFFGFGEFYEKNRTFFQCNLSQKRLELP